MKSIFLLLTFLTFFMNISSMGQNTISDKSEQLQKVLTKLVDNKKVFGASFCMKHKGEVWCSSAGSFENDEQYFIASTTKLFVTSIILKLVAEGKLSLEDSISKFLDEQTMKGLHVFKGTDYSDQITVKNLLAHTSGIPDYFQNKGESGKSLEYEIIKGNDQFWTFEQAIQRSKEMKPLFAPDAKGKAHYSDANFQLLGRIIENITGKSLSENCQELIFQPLNLTKTYLYTDISDNKPKTLYYKQNELVIPKAMTSFGADGGIVSTSQELLTFIEAFFNGILFPKEYLKDLQEWNRIFSPLKSGVGIHLFKLPWIFNPTGLIPELLGHSGLSGALAYYSPKEDLYIVGTVNQVAYPSTSFKVAIKLIQKVLVK